MDLKESWIVFGLWKYDLWQKKYREIQTCQKAKELNKWHVFHLKLYIPMSLLK